MQLLPGTLEEMYKNGYSLNLKGEKQKLDDCIRRDEATSIAQVLHNTKATVSIETGVASGASALAICHILKQNGNGEARHYGVDPNQMSYYGGAAMANLEKEGLSGIFHLLEGPSHQQIPELISKGEKVDFALIDGWHTFDYTLIDFFLVDKLLKPGGYIAFHDVYGRAKQKVINFILTHRKYRIAKEAMHFDKEQYIRTFRFFLWRLYKDPGLLFSWYHWKYQSKNSSGLLILQKLEDFEPDYDFFKNF